MDSENPRTGANGAGASTEASSTSPPLAAILRGVPPITILRALAKDRAELGHVIDTAIEILNRLDGDPDREDGGDDEPREADGDTQDASVPEWTGLHPAWRRGPVPNPGNEDDEEDDAPEEDDPQGACDEDEVSAGLHSCGWYASGPGCPIADPDHGHDGS